MLSVVKRPRSPDLAELRAERDDLAANNGRLEDRIRTYEALLTAAAHDLKNSLGSITMRADLLQDELEEALEQPVSQGIGSLKAGTTRARCLG
jgi:signal transduction histidine kinase